MILLQLRNLVDQIEERFPVDRWALDGIHVWPIIRTQLIYGALNASAQSNFSSAYHAGKMKKIGRFCGELLLGVPRFCAAYFSDLKKNDRIEKQADVVFISDGFSGEMINGMWQDRFCDPLIRRFHDRKMETLLLTLTHEYRVPRHNISVFIQLRADFIRAWAFLKKGMIAGDSSTWEEFDEFDEFWRSQNIPFQPPGFSEIKRRVSEISAYSKFYKNILARSGARAAFYSNYYDHHGFALNLACRSLGILSVDIQHGNQGENNVAYGRWNRVPPEGYELLPSVFWCWGEYEEKAISQWNSKTADKHRPLVGGNLWLNDSKDDSRGEVNGFSEKVKAIKNSHSEAIHILVTLQYDYSEKSLKPVLKAAQASNPHWRWWFRLHPLIKNEKEVFRDILEKYQIRNSEIDLPNEIPLCELLKGSDVLITEYSTTIIEAGLFGVASVAISKEVFTMYPDQIASQKTVFADTPDTIVTAIKAQSEKTRDSQGQNKSGRQTLADGTDAFIRWMRER